MTRLKLGILKKVNDNPYDTLNEKSINNKEHIKLAKKVAQKSIVLLKNKNNILPLSKNINRLFITGPNSANVNTLLGNYNGLSPNIVTPLEGIAAKVSNGTIIRFNQGVDLINSNNRLEWSSSLAGSSDATIAVMGISALIEGEEGAAISSEANGDRNSISLPKNQIDYLRNLRKSAGDKPIVLVIKAGSAIDLSEISKYADAIIYAWYLGEQGGNALADIIFGDVSPSGKLPITIPKSLSHLPKYNNYNMYNRTYKFTKYKPMYPFGFGLSYSNFIYSDLSFNRDIIKYFNNDHKNLKKIVFFGIASAVALTIHSIFLGIKFDNDLYKLFRRVVMLSFIIFEISGEVSSTEIEGGLFII